MTMAVYKSPAHSEVGNAALDVVRLNGADSVHLAAFGQQFCEIIEHEAKAFGAAFDSASFNRVIDAVSSRKAQAYFLLAGKEACRPHFIGASIQFMSVISKWNGQDFEHFRAPYIEDMCISSLRLSSFIRSRGLVFGKDVSLGTKFMQGMVNASIENSYADTPVGVSGRGFIAEYAPDGKQIIRVLKKFGATLGQEHTSAIMELDNTSLHPSVDVDVQGLASDNEDYSDIFVVSWANATNQQRIIANFTEAISSFTGEPIIRVQFSTNGCLPSKEIMPEIMKSMLAEGAAEAAARNWFEGQTANAKMRIHVLEEPQIISALQATGASPRMLGNRPMLPLVTDFRNSPSGILSTTPVTDKPLRINKDSFILTKSDVFITNHVPRVA
jgi:hypothetical protein